MTAPGSLGHLWIIGPGRLGLGLGSALRATGLVSSLTYSGRHETPPAHPIFTSGYAAYRPMGTRPPADPTALLICVPDDAIAGVADRVSALDLPRSTVLHTSGASGSDLLISLAEVGWETGSLHPLVSVTDYGLGERLRGGWFSVEGAPEAVGLARELVDALGGQILSLRGEGKPLYHAAAVFASNYVVALLDVAIRLMQEAGATPEDATLAVAALAGGAAQNVGQLGSTAALTGPVARGDMGTIEQHLSRLSQDDRALYSVLAREAIRIALAGGLPTEQAARIVSILEAERA